jgi:hypothetical protein
MKLRTGKEIGYEFSRGADYILFSVNDWRRALSKKEKRDLFMEVIETYGCKFVMTATEYYPYLVDTNIFRNNERNLPEMYFLKGIEKEEFSYKIDFKIEKDNKIDLKSQLIGFKWKEID